MQTEFIKILEDRLNLELSKYSNLPFYLAYLYITLKKSNIIYFNGYYIKYNKIDQYTNPSDPEKDYLIGSFDNMSYHSFPNMNSLLFNPFLVPMYVVNKAGKRDLSLNKRARTNNNNYVYYRHPNLKSLINSICDQYRKNNEGLPFKYVIPYLFFNRDKEIAFVTLDGTTNLKYDLQNETLREKDPYHNNSKYFKVVSYEKIINWYDLSMNFLYCHCYFK
jgi:hypothetical protein